MTTPTPKQAAELTDAQVMDIALKARRTMDSELERDYIQQVPASAIRNFVRTILTAQANDAKAQEDAKRYRHLRNSGLIVASKIGKGIGMPPYANVSEQDKIELDFHIDKAIQGMQTGSVE